MLVPSNEHRDCVSHIALDVISHLVRIKEYVSSTRPSKLTAGLLMTLLETKYELFGTKICKLLKSKHWFHGSDPFRLSGSQASTFIIDKIKRTISTISS
jgi:hypothetical protein